MESSFLSAVLEYGAMGLFAAFLVWQHLSMQKRFDKLIDRFQEQLKGIQEKGETNEDKLRERYDTVIKQYQDEKTTFRDSVAGRVSEVIKYAESLKSQIADLPFEKVQIQIESLSLSLRNIQISIDKGMEIVKKMQEEAKLKEMARKMAERDS